MSDDTEGSAAMLGSVAGEPAAWGVLRVGGSWVSILANEVQADTSRKSFDKMENWAHEIVPLYRSPTLTDEEVEAVEWCIFQQAVPQKTAVTMRRMLERLK